MRHPELVHDVSVGALRHGLGQPGIQPRADDAPSRRLLEGDVLVLSALEMIAHFAPPGHRAAEDAPVHGAPALGGRDLLQVRNSVRTGSRCAGGRAEGCAAAATRGEMAGASGLRSEGFG